MVLFRDQLWKWKWWSTWRTRLIHWKLSSSEASGLCSATTTILSSCSTDTENTAILQHATEKNNVTPRLHWVKQLVLPCTEKSTTVQIWVWKIYRVFFFFFTSPCTQTSWAPLPALWPLHHLHCAFAHWPPSAHRSSQQWTRGCPGEAHKAQAVDGWISMFPQYGPRTAQG